MAISKVNFFAQKEILAVINAFTTLRIYNINHLKWEEKKFMIERH